MEIYWVLGIPLVGVLVMGIFFFQIRETFDSLDLKHMEKLKER